ncbi:dTDP-4-dehydrorhamnose reductase [Lentibacillus persicus]|uniref:dTDP-4-dehydrorhamnose reductase n=1 Tax=Lentibacillus persicus TaxID=640948 RepID=A0A1I1XLI8_9BACI|nr:sugar nucleotide-binding protein [Lentibacillus persicus]SFE08176.1 dTDP-4-dehydrorhamnose reductase [Lentibacillus persicus]
MKVCVFGASGYAGSSVYDLLRKDSDIDVTGTYLEEPAAFDDLYKLDVNEPESFSAFYKEQQPDVVVWSVMSGPYEDELVHEGLRHVITHLTPQTKLVYLSTDFVFTEGSGPYYEDHPTSGLPEDHPLSTYTNAKVKAERFISRELLNYTILRAGPIYGENKIGQLDERTDKLLAQLRLRNTAAYRDDLIRTFVHVNDLAGSAVEFVKNDLTGIYHAGPDKRHSFYEFMTQMAEQLGYSADSVEKASEYEEPDKEIPKNTALKTEKIRNAIKQKFR